MKSSRHEPTCEDFFLKSLDFLSPENLLKDVIQYDEHEQCLKIGKEHVTSKRCYVVGFGKAVLGLGAHIAKVLGAGSLLEAGILSIPSGTSSNEKFRDWLRICQDANVKVIEGAKDNLPDEDSYRAAQAIIRLVSDLSEDDVVIVLISGGGSALLSLPIEGVTLAEKLKIIRSLSRAGASITELNTVRKALSSVKGGKLAAAIRPARSVSLVLSDIIGDPLDFIASGPTVPNTDPPNSAFNVLNKYNLVGELTDNARTATMKCQTAPQLQTLETAEVVVVGNNQLVLRQLKSQALKVR